MMKPIRTPSKMTKSLYTSFLLLTIILLQHLTLVTSQSGCSSGYKSSCSWSGQSAQISVKLQVNDNSVTADDTYTAQVEYHWGPTSTSSTINEYNFGQEHWEDGSHVYGESSGVYDGGYSIHFGEGACAGKIFSQYFTITFEDGDSKFCAFGEGSALEVTTAAPTVAPTSLAPITATPTQTPTLRPTTSSPTFKPTNAPTTSSPTPSPIAVTLKPTTKSPTKTPTVVETEPPFIPLLPTRPITPSPVSDAPITTSSPTPSPTTPEPTMKMPVTLKPIFTRMPIVWRTPAPVVSPPRPTPDTPSPTASPVTASPTTNPVEVGSPTSPPTLIADMVVIQDYTISSTMTLNYSNELGDASISIWVSVTQTTIKNEVIKEIGAEAYEQLVEVNVTLVNQYAKGMLSRRNLQVIQTPLQIEFTTSIRFPSETDAPDYNATKMVAAGFETPAQQEQYMETLKEYDAGTYVNLETMSIQVGTTPTPEDPVTPKNNTMFYIIGGIVGGVLVLGFFGGIGVYYLRRKRRNQEQGGGEGSENNKSGKSLAGVTTQQATKGSDKLNIAPGDDEYIYNSKNSPTRSQLHQQESDNFGYIESKEGDMDDISTIGDPYIGDVPNANMDMDNTVGESMVSSQQELYVYGVRRPGQAGMDAHSRMGGSTIASGYTGTLGSKAMIFGDDTTLEDIYQTPSGASEGEDLSFQKLTVVCPAGKLGIVLDNPHGDLPIVYAIKETSPLDGKVRVGDLLLFVDEIDCRGMSAHKLSQFLSSRSKNPARTLVLARGNGIMPGATGAV